MLTPGEIAQDVEEMATLVPEFITADILTFHRKNAIKLFRLVISTLATEKYRQEDTQRGFNRVIQVLREAVVLNPDLHISYTLATVGVSLFASRRYL